ncbi:MAG: DUF1893 domain-containing protein [Lachnospiraceae bacterium]|nr:DUF1893 domain-containing protein [Lachnospiraceae bacterium]
MKNDWIVVKEQLKMGEYTCVLGREGTLYTSKERGVKPLMEWIAQGVCLEGFSAADKVVGKATAFLYVLAGVRQVYAPVMSEAAMQVFVRYGIQTEADQIVPAIRNRSNTGLCPMETAVSECETPEDAYIIILEKLKELSIKN